MALDGNTLRHSFDRATDQSALLPRLPLTLITKTKRPKASVRGSIERAGWDTSFRETILVGQDAIALSFLTWGEPDGSMAPQ